MKNINLSTQQAKQLYREHPEWRNTVLDQFTDDELGIEPQLPKSWEDLREVDGYWADAYCDIQFGTRFYTTNSSSQLIFPTEKQVKSTLAFAKLSQLAKAMNGGWEPDWNDENVQKYIVEYQKGFLTIESYASIKSHLCFKTKKIAEFSRENHRQLWEDYWMI